MALSSSYPPHRFVTGAIGSGKTSKMLQLYAAEPKKTADGLVSVKTITAAGFIRYDLQHLSTGTAKLWSVEYHPSDPVSRSLGPAFCFDRFRFSRETWEWSLCLLRNLAADADTSVVYLDEVGPLELEGRGFASAMPHLLASGKQLVICVRRQCLEAVIEYFSIDESQITVIV